MKINDKYGIELCIVEEAEDGTPIGAYDNLETFRMKKPNSSYRYGYYIVDLFTGCVPHECKAWYHSPEEAYADYLYLVKNA